VNIVNITAKGNTMTHDWTVSSRGIQIPAPVGVYDQTGESMGTIAFLVCYGDSGQTRAISARVATREPVYLVAPDDTMTELLRPVDMRARGASLPGHGHRLIIWDERAPETMALWLTEQDRLPAIARAIEAYRIPYDPAWLPDIAAFLADQDMLIPLVGWGGAGGVSLAIREDDVCDWLAQRFGRPRRAVREIPRPRRRRGPIQPVKPTIRQEAICVAPRP
jgi:hypothetical protein